MSVQSEITRLQNAKAAIKTAIEGKGVTVPDGTLLDVMASLIESIETGGGFDFSSVLSGTMYTESGSYTVASDRSTLGIPISAKPATHELRMVLLWTDTDADVLGMFGFRGNAGAGSYGIQTLMTLRHASIKGACSKPTVQNPVADFGPEGSTGYGGGGIIELTINGIWFTPYSSLSFTAGTTYNYIIVSGVK